MEISRNNYETWFIDYFDNILAPQDVAELLVFLEENPDLKEEFENFENILLPSEAVPEYPGKDNLKIYSVTDDEIISFLEGDMTVSQREAFDSRIKQDAQLQNEVNLFRNTFIKPDLSVVYPGKSSLKLYSAGLTIKTILYFSMAAAAAIILLLLVSYFAKDTTQPPLALKKIFKTQDNYSRFGAGIEDTINLDTSIIAVNLPLKSSASITRLPSSELIIRDTKAPDYLVPYSAPSFISVVTCSDTILNRDQFGLLYEYIVFKENEWIKEQSFASRFLGATISKISPFRNQEKKHEEQNRSFLAIMVKGYAMMTDKELDYNEITDKAGQVIAYSLNGEKLEFSRIRRNNLKLSSEKE